MEVNDAEGNDTIGVDEETLRGGSTQSSECPDRIQKDGLGRGMMVVGRQEVSAIPDSDRRRVPSVMKRTDPRLTMCAVPIVPAGSVSVMSLNPLPPLSPSNSTFKGSLVLRFYGFTVSQPHSICLIEHVIMQEGYHILDCLSCIVFFKF